MSNPPTEPAASGIEKIFAFVFGSFLGLALLKFATPSVMDRFVTAPTSGIEWLIFVWPLKTAYPLAGIVLLCGLAAARWKRIAPRWLMLLPAAWLMWQLVAGSQSLDFSLTQGVLVHFTVCLICFYLGAASLSHRGVIPFFVWPLTCAYAVMLYVGLNQHFGGLEESRKYFWTYIYPALPNVPPEYLGKMKSNRIFSTVFYPNAFAGALLLLLPPLLVWIWQAKQRFTVGARSLLCGLLATCSAACLFWTGSKGGWLLALLMGFTALLHQQFSRSLKWALIGILLFTGGAGFYWKNRAYMERGATSVVARFDYWRAAWQTATAKPLFGSGPGTFAIAYQAVKKPESEMARLTHNDYLQQASDSGFPGLVLYTAFIGGMLCISYRRLDWHKSPMICAIWLGISAWTAQSAIEFTLYVPALAWTAFGLMGWLLGSTQETIRQDPIPNPNLSSR